MTDATTDSAESELEPLVASDDLEAAESEFPVGDEWSQDGLPDDAAAAVLAVGRDALRGVSDGLRRAMTAGVRTVLTADERLKDALPDELAAYVARQTEAVKGEIVRAIGRQTRSFLDQMDLQSEMRRLLADMTIEVTTTVRMVPRKEGAEGPGAQVVFSEADSAGTLDGAALAPLVDTVLRSLVREWTLEQAASPEAGEVEPNDGDADADVDS